MKLREYIGWLVLAGSLATGYVLLRLGLPPLVAGAVAAALWLGYAVWQMQRRINDIRSITTPDPEDDT